MESVRLDGKRRRQIYLVCFRSLVLLFLVSHDLQSKLLAFSHPVRVHSLRINQLEVDEFNRFILRSPAKVAGPFKKHLDNNNREKPYLLLKAAELTVDEYERTSGKPHRLRKVLNLQKVSGSDINTFSFRLDVLLQDAVGGSLKERHFTAVIRKRGNRVSFELDELRRKRLENIDNIACDELSTWANCKKCGYNGICEKGNARISPWLAFALKTQTELQHDDPFDQLQMLGAHNAFNDRADGYGIVDDCHWPPPYNKCVNLANQEFSFTDLLDMGVRALEIDPWWCFGKMRMSHAHDHWYLGCAPWDREFKDGMKEIGMWVHKPENSNEIVRLYFEDGETHTDGHDDLINGPIKEFLGDKVLTPKEMKTFFPNRWPTPREMRKINKTVVIATAGQYTHQGIFIHNGYWTEITVNRFTPYPNCSNFKPGTTTRVYSDSTQYGPFWNGPKQTGVILDYKKFMKCGINYLGADQVNPHLLKSAVFTWAQDEPSEPLTEESCVILCAADEQWYVENCTEQHYFACSTGEGYTSQWAVSSSNGTYARPTCPEGCEFDVPHNGFQNQKLLESMKGKDVWINFSPYIPLVMSKGE